jgi:sugar-specific transcriptional regulator TrmB
MNKEKFIAKMLELGISQREAKVYLALLTKNHLTATEVAKISGIPRQKIYSVLSNMVNNGMCKEKAGRVKKYKAVNPNYVCNGLISRYREKEKAAHNLSKDLTDIYEENLQKIDPLEYIEILKNKLQIKRRVSDYVSKAQNSILVFSKSPYTENFNENTDEDIGVIKKTVTIKSIYEYKDFKNEDYIKEISAWIGKSKCDL